VYFNYPVNLYLVMSLERAINTLSYVEILFRRSFAYFKKNGFEYCSAKVKNIKKIFDPKNF